MQYWSNKQIIVPGFEYKQIWTIQIRKKSNF